MRDRKHRWPALTCGCGGLSCPAGRRPANLAGGLEAGGLEAAGLAHGCAVCVSVALRQRLPLIDSTLPGPLGLLQVFSQAQVVFANKKEKNGK